MTVNIRPEGVDLDYYPGNPIVLTVNFPAGYLSTRVIKSFLNGRGLAGVEGTCVESTDTLTITFTGTQTLTFDYPVVWEMDLFDTPNYTVLLTGIWSPGTDGSNGPSTATYTVDISPTLTVTVTALSVTSSELILGDRVSKSTDVASPLTIAAGSAYTTITEAIMDGTFGSIAGVAWSNGDDQFNITTAGLFFCYASLTLDSSAKTAFAGTFDAYFSTNEETVAVPPYPYGSGIDVDYSLTATLYIPAGSYVRLSARSRTTGIDIPYAELTMRRLS